MFFLYMPIFPLWKYYFIIFFSISVWIYKKMFLFLQSNVIGFYALKVALIDINTPLDYHRNFCL